MVCPTDTVVTAMQEYMNKKGKSIKVEYYQMNKMIWLKMKKIEPTLDNCMIMRVQHFSVYPPYELWKSNRNQREPGKIEDLVVFPNWTGQCLVAELGKSSCGPLK